MALAPGTRVGPYEITALIGAGGMGEVYQASDSKLKRQVAIKVLPEMVAADRDRLARFQREAQVLAALNHPNIAAIYGLEESGGFTALVMELVEGPTLADRVAEGRLPVDEALAIARQIAEAVEAAHDQGIIHRDLKPANVKLRSDGSVKVLDFGLAKSIEPTAAASELSQSPTITTPAMTQAGMILGTAAYMSPEQARGRFVDRRTDVWAFGCVLFEMLTGRRAFDGEDVTETLAAVVKSDPPWNSLPPLPPLVTAFLRQSLVKDWKKRLGDIRDMRLALSGELALDAPPSVSRTRSLWPVAAAVTIVLAAVIGLAGWSLRTREPVAVTRFEYLFPDGQDLGVLTRRVVAVSPDGRTFLYRASRGLYVRSMGELQSRLLVSAADNPFDGAFSPDGQWVIYFGATRPVLEPGSAAAEPRGQLKRVSVTGGAVTVLCSVTNASTPIWGEDGTILFGDSKGIMRVPATGGEPELIVPAQPGEQLHRPQFVPGANAILFSVTTSEGRNRWEHATVAVQRLGSGEPRRTLVSDAADGTYLSSGQLVYVRKGVLFGVAFDARTLTASGGEVSLAEGIQEPSGMRSAGMNFDVSSSGTLVYLTTQSNTRSLLWVERSGAAVPVTTIPAANYEDPRLSPDGTRVVITRDADIWVFELLTGRGNRITRDGSSLMGAWHPSGERIAHSSARSGTLEAWVSQVDGSGEPRQLTKFGRGVVHVDSWSPDGTTLTFHHHAGAGITGMYMVDPEGGGLPQKFAEGEAPKESAHFSPDGSHVVFLSSESGGREIYVRPRAASNRQTTVSTSGGVEPLWGRSGEIFYRSFIGDRMFSVAASTTPALKVGAPELLFEVPYYVARSGSPRAQYDVTHDGKRFLMLSTPTAAAADRPRLIIVQNWMEEVKRLIPSN
jgi:serine/threonine-protein kinase